MISRRHDRKMLAIDFALSSCEYLPRAEAEPEGLFTPVRRRHAAEDKSRPATPSNVP